MRSTICRANRQVVQAIQTVFPERGLPRIYFLLTLSSYCRYCTPQMHSAYISYKSSTNSTGTLDPEIIQGFTVMEKMFSLNVCKNLSLHISNCIDTRHGKTEWCEKEERMQR